MQTDRNLPTPSKSEETSTRSLLSTQPGFIFEQHGGEGKTVQPLSEYLDKKLTWQTLIKAKRRQLELKIRNMNWLINKKITPIP
jgi:hypothetical protein